MNPFSPRRSASAGAAIHRAKALDMFTPPEPHTKKTVQFDVPPPDDWVEVSKESLDGLQGVDLPNAQLSRAQEQRKQPTYSKKHELFLTRPVRTSKRDCTICMCTIEGSVIRSPCGHYFDLPCLLALVRSAIQDESLFPPQCCSLVIPALLFKPHMDRALATLFREKNVEFSVPNRVYCARQTCSHFLGARGGGSHHSYTCADCFTRTCSRCRCEMKRNVLHACRPDTVSKLLLESRMARNAGWMRCPGCERILELQSGCYHVTCHCKTQFCYKCGAKWKTCACPLYDERLQEHAEGFIQERVLTPPPVLPPLARHARMRETWIQAQDPPVNTASVPTRRRERASAPAQMQTRVPVQDILLRGVHAQERRRGRPTTPDSKFNSVLEDQGEESRTPQRAFAGGNLDALDEQINGMIYAVEHYQCTRV